MRRLFLMLLLLGFALPPLLACIGNSQAMAQEPAAMASCHEGGGGPSPAHDREPHQPRHEECIGCIAPLAIVMFRPVSDPDFYLVNFGPMLIGPELIARPNAPEPPPPKDIV
ncbi:MAG: hypothetical protein R3E11_10005 [Sphingobium sp.]